MPGKFLPGAYYTLDQLNTHIFVVRLRSNKQLFAIFWMQVRISKVYRKSMHILKVELYQQRTTVSKPNELVIIEMPMLFAL